MTVTVEWETAEQRMERLTGCSRGRESDDRGGGGGVSLSAGRPVS
jgi:hypothetical protein